MVATSVSNIKLAKIQNCTLAEIVHCYVKSTLEAPLPIIWIFTQKSGFTTEQFQRIMFLDLVTNKYSVPIQPTICPPKVLRVRSSHGATSHPTLIFPSEVITQGKYMK